MMVDVGAGINNSSRSDGRAVPAHHSGCLNNSISQFWLCHASCWSVCSWCP
jgi:hypothetical protein